MGRMTNVRSAAETEKWFALRCTLKHLANAQKPGKICEKQLTGC